jgi:DNA-binding LacI/PurR family transcriptional regulator
MRRHGLGAQIRVLPGAHTEESGAAAVRTLIDSGGLPTAIFASNDRCAHGVLGTLVRAGLTVPGDMSVVGFDDSGVARLSFIDLTTVRQDVIRMAEAAVEAVVERLDRGRAEAREVVLEPALVVRSTTAAPRPA